MVRGFEGAFRRHPGLPVTLLGAVYAGFGLAHLWRLDQLMLVDWIAFGLYEFLALFVIFGGLLITTRGLPISEGRRVVVATLGFGTLGFAVAAALIAIEVRRGTPLHFAWFARMFASVTTATIGVGLALYDVELRGERSNLAAQHETVNELNKRLTVLHRVLRHNLRNELTVIRGHAELLIERDLPAEVLASLETMTDHTTRVQSLSENAYRLRQVWAEDTRVEREITALVEDCVRRIEAITPGVDIETTMPADVHAMAHPRFGLAISEALENAVTHNDPDAVAVDVTVAESNGRNSDVEIVVADTGRGIPDAERSILEQVEERPLSHGTGLGLWLMYWLVEQSGGKLQFEPNDPHGTVVRMQLPAAA